jgi:hypothetical protein
MQCHVYFNSEAYHPRVSNYLSRFLAAHDCQRIKLSMHATEHQQFELELSRIRYVIIDDDIPASMPFVRNVLTPLLELQTTSRSNRLWPFLDDVVNNAAPLIDRQVILRIAPSFPEPMMNSMS